MRQMVILCSDQPLNLFGHHPIALFILSLTVFSIIFIVRYQRSLAKQ